MAVDPELVQQIVEAVDKLPWALWCKQQMAAAAGPGPGAQITGDNAPLAAMGDAGGGAAALAGVSGDGPSPPMAPSPAPPAPAAENKPADAPPKKDAADGSPAMNFPKEPTKMAAAANDGTPDNDDPEKKEYAALCSKYGADEQYKRYLALKKKYGGDAADEYQQVPPDGSQDTLTIPPGGAGPQRDAEPQRDSAQRRYEAGDGPDGDNPQRPANDASLDPGLTNPAQGSEGQDRGEAATKYARAGEVEKYRRRVEELEARSTNAERYQRLHGLRMRTAFDLDQAVDMTKYGKMSDTDFERHIGFIEANCRAIPIGSDLPYDDSAQAAASAAHAADRPGGRQLVGRYRKEHSDTAFKICVDRRMAGKDVDYEQVVEAIAAGRQPIFPD